MLSVVIPAYNAEDTIGEQLSSLAAQHVRDDIDFEVVVADNGSRDRTLDVVAGFDDRLPLRVIDAAARRGPAAARNIGAAASVGDLLVFTDADDVTLDGWLGAWSTLDPGVVFATGPIVPFRDGEQTTTTRDDAADSPPVHLGFLPYAPGTNLAVRRSHFERLGGFPETWVTAEDVALSWRLQLAGARLEWVDDAAVAARRRGSSRALVRRYYAYGLADPELYVEFHDAGVERPTPRSVLWSYLGLVGRLPLLWQAEPRRRWCTQLGRRAGRIVGSARARTLVL